MRETAQPARCDSSKKWTVRSFLLTETVKPRGLDGGEDGQLGKTLVRRQDGGC